MKKKNGGRPFGRRPEEERIPYFKLHPESIARPTLQGRRAHEQEQDSFIHRSVFAVSLRNDEVAGGLAILLVHKRIPSTWALPGGSTAAGEDPKTVLSRKVYEKSGHGIVGIPELMLRQQVTETHEKLVFLARVDENCDPPSSDKIDGVRWFTLKELASMPHYPYDGEAVDAEADYFQENQRADILRILDRLKESSRLGSSCVVAAANLRATRQGA